MNKPHQVQRKKSTLTSLLQLEQVMASLFEVDSKGVQIKKKATYLSVDVG
jgi:hypothetical protein